MSVPDSSIVSVLVPALAGVALVVLWALNAARPGWSGPAGIRVEGGSFGLQIGGSATDVILLVMNERGVDRILSNQFKVGADAFLVGEYLLTSDDPGAAIRDLL